MKLRVSSQRIINFGGGGSDDIIVVLGRKLVEIDEKDNDDRLKNFQYSYTTGVKERRVSKEKREVGLKVRYYGSLSRTIHYFF